MANSLTDHRTTARGGPHHWLPALGGLGALALWATIGGVPAAAATQPLLGTVVNFAVVAGAAVATVPPTTVNGNLALDPGTSAGDIVVTGYSDIGPTNSTAVTAQNDLTVAYTDAANATPADDLTTAGGTTQLGGATLTPGVYKITNDALLDGTLTLNGEGQTNPTFIFQLAVSLTTGTGSSVVLENGASGCALFWQVTSAAVLGSSTDFQGNLMAASGITMGSGSNIGLGGGVDGGRALVSTAGPLTSDGDNQITPPPISCVFAAAITTTSTPSTTGTPTTGAFGVGPNGLPLLDIALTLFAVGLLATSTGLWMRRKDA